LALRIAHERLRMRRLRAIEPIIAVLAAFLVLTLNSESLGQFSTNPIGSSSPKAQSERSSDTYAPVGPSGYKILIPEIKMNQIIGDIKTKPPVVIPPESTTPESTPDESVEKETPRQPHEPSEQTRVEDTHESATRLPFDHRYKKPTIPVDKEDLATDVRNRIERENPLLGPPLAPINITEALPEPTKEILGKRQSITLPKVKELETLKSEQKAFPVPVFEDRGSLAAEDWVVLQTRKDADKLPLEESQQETPLSKESHPQEPSTTGVQNIGQPKEEPDVTASEKEHRQIKEFEDTGRGFEGEVEIQIPAKEQILSPLDQQAANEKDLRAYLSETAPVLEELSLLMARAPSLNLVDYDPSELNTPVIPQDLGLKLESLKRDLRILDSKVFSIIPPSKYSQFHELIRQSISHTYLACEAISGYFQDAKPEELQKVKEHLVKAKELIQQTRKRNGSG
jgi:hypothetical protein